MNTSNQKTGLFHACYEIGGDMPGAPLFKVNLGVYTPKETISGVGHITQAVNPPLDLATNLNGNYTYMCVMPKNCHILVVLTGHPIVDCPHGAGIGPVVLPNVTLRMVLDESWKSGTANYKYQDADGKWHDIKNAPVKMVAGDSIA